jgi:hypothetical protein
LPQINSKQILKVLAGVVRLGGVSATGGSTNITTALGTALSTAGAGGVSVPVQPSVSLGLGLITTGSTNRVEINDGTLFVSGNEVYGRLTETGGVYTVTYFTLVAGVETAHSFGSATTVNLDIPYRFDFARYPTDSPIATAYRIVGGTASAPARIQTEPLTVTATNTLSELAFTPDVTANVTLFVNGVAYHSLGTADFTVSVKTITWNQTNAGFALGVGEFRVIASYTTLG